jgi:hypothetical protein
MYAHTGEEDAKEITTRNLMFLSAIYAPLLLNSHGYSLRQVWDILNPAIVQRNEQVVCAPLLNWLRVASTGIPSPNPLEMNDPSITKQITAPPADELLLAHHHAILHQALPGLTVPPQT